ncbi:MAG TPA: hypothetical protein ENN32_06165 [Chloroflexi bacterium]|nr:hypothetical protein [Chloroflexota bacterium]
MAMLVAGLAPLQEDRVLLTEPVNGSILQGNVLIRGNTDVAGFKSFALEFAHESGTNDTTWFLLHESNERIAEGILTTWDTQQITDGDYRLRLTVFFEDDRPQYDYATDLKVRNYSEVSEEDRVMPTPVPTEIPLEGDFEISEEPETGTALWASMLRGMLYTVLVIIFLAVLFYIYTQFNRRKKRQRRR